MAGPSFSVAVMSKESPETLRRFCSYYLSLGAAEILLFLDGPSPFDADPALGSGVVLEACDEAFWALHGPRPNLVEERQSIVYSVARGRCNSDWMLVVDSDEFVFGDVDVNAFLRGLPDTVDGVRVASAEAVFGPGDDINRQFGSTWFRRPLSGRRWHVVRHFYDQRTCAAMFQGLLGHAAGKHFLRTKARDATIQIHDSKRDGRDISVPVALLLPRGRSMWLGHFDAMSFPEWQAKWRRRACGAAKFHDVARPNRNEQLRAYREAQAEGAPALEALFRRYYCFTSFQAVGLKAAGAAFARDIFDPDEVRRQSGSRRSYTIGLGDRTA